MSQRVFEDERQIAEGVLCQIKKSKELIPTAREKTYDTGTCVIYLKDKHSDKTILIISNHLAFPPWYIEEILLVRQRVFWSDSMWLDESLFYQQIVLYVALRCNQPCTFIQQGLHNLHTFIHST
jgi:hypothetical protein